MKRKFLKKIFLAGCVMLVFCSGCRFINDHFTGNGEKKLYWAMEVPAAYELLDEAVEEGADLDAFSVYNGIFLNGKYERNPMRIGMDNLLERYTMQRMLELGADPNAVDCEGYPLIFRASAWTDDEQSFELFVSHGANAAARAENGETILDYYLKNRSGASIDGIYLDGARRKMVELMLEQNVPVEEKTWDLAEQTKAYHLLDLLCQAYPKGYDTLSQMQKDFLDGKIDDANQMLKDSETLSEKDQYIAVDFGNGETIEILKEKQVDFWREHGDSASLGYAAIYSCNTETAGKILDLTEPDQKNTSYIKKAIYQMDHVGLIRYLCQSGWLSIETLSEEDAGTIAAVNALDVMTYILENGYDFSKNKSAGNQALTKAIREDNREMLKLLLENGANLNYEGEEGYPLENACITGNPENITLLLQYGADVEKAGDGAMWSAVSSMNLDAIKILAESGVPVSEQTYRLAKEDADLENNHVWEYVSRLYEQQQ